MVLSAMPRTHYGVHEHIEADTTMELLYRCSYACCCHD
jgi:hypothetical protein